MVNFNCTVVLDLPGNVKQAGISKKKMLTHSENRTNDPWLRKQPSCRLDHEICYKRTVNSLSGLPVLFLSAYTTW